METAKPSRDTQKGNAVQQSSAGPLDECCLQITDQVVGRGGVVVVVVVEVVVVAVVAIVTVQCFGGQLLDSRLEAASSS